MLSLKEKHLQACHASRYMSDEMKKIVQHIAEDLTGSCWHIDEVIAYAHKKALYLDSLSRSEKQALPLYGLSMGLKDLFCVKGMTTTAGSRVLEHFKSPYSSTVYETLSQKGALLATKLAMDEFAMGSFSDTSSFGRVSLPGFPQRSAGGSSGGSAAALASGIVDFTMGSDTGGSVRQPASFSSVVGFKPTYGTFSRFGMIAYASSLDQAGVFTHTLEDLEYLLESQIAVADSKDMTCSGLAIQKKEHISGLKTTMGFFPQMLEDESIEKEVREAYAKTLDKLRHAGICLKEVDIPLMKDAASIYYILACSEAASNLARYQGVYFGEKLIDKHYEGTFWQQAASYRSEYLGLEVQKRIMLGSFVLSSENFTAMYQKATHLRKMLKEQFSTIFDKVDMLVLPVTPMIAPEWDTISKMTSAQIYMSDYMTVPFSLAGLPAISLPWEKSSQGLGIGMQCVAPWKEDLSMIKQLKLIETCL
jgi:aspartyl-tRNA(Asn)/glutamyl-tRNA(Gln) amidotransferase subunit A